MNWDSAMGDFLSVMIMTLVFIVVTLIAAKLKGEF